MIAARAATIVIKNLVMVRCCGPRERRRWTGAYSTIRKASACSHCSRLLHGYSSAFGNQWVLLLGQSIAKGDGFQLDANSVLNGNHWARLEYERRQHRAELVNRRWIIAIQHHITTPVTDSNDKE